MAAGLKLLNTFSGGGSIPFEAHSVRLRCIRLRFESRSAYADMGAMNVIKSSPERRLEIETAQKVADVVDQEITALGIEHDEHGNRAKSYLYCLETNVQRPAGWCQCPKLGYFKVKKMSSRGLFPNHQRKRFDIEVIMNASAAEMKEADKRHREGKAL